MWGNRSKVLRVSYIDIYTQVNMRFCLFFCLLHKISYLLSTIYISQYKKRNNQQSKKIIVYRLKYIQCKNTVSWRPIERPSKFKAIFYGKILKFNIQQKWLWIVPLKSVHGSLSGCLWVHNKLNLLRWYVLCTHLEHPISPSLWRLSLCTIIGPDRIKTYLSREINLDFTI